MVGGLIDLFLGFWVRGVEEERFFILRSWDRFEIVQGVKVKIKIQRLIQIRNREIYRKRIRVFLDRGLRVEYVYVSYFILCKEDRNLTFRVGFMGICVKERSFCVLGQGLWFFCIYFGGRQGRVGKIDVQGNVRFQGYLDWKVEMFLGRVGLDVRVVLFVVGFGSGVGLGLGLRFFLGWLRERG